MILIKRYLQPLLLFNDSLCFMAKIRARDRAHRGGLVQPMATVRDKRSSPC